jgi:hypothetical protein
METEVETYFFQRSLDPGILFAAHDSGLSESHKKDKSHHTLFQPLSLMILQPASFNASASVR